MSGHGRFRDTQCSHLQHEVLMSVRNVAEVWIFWNVLFGQLVKISLTLDTATATASSTATTNYTTTAAAATNTIGTATTTTINYDRYYYSHSVGIATLYGPGIESQLGPDFPPPPILPYNGYWVFPGDKAVGAWPLPPTSFQCRG